MKTKSPICPKCRKPMKVMYTKKSFVFEGKCKTYWSKEGYLCNHLYFPVALITTYNEYAKDKSYKGNFKVSVYDYDLELIKDIKLDFLRKINK